MVSLGFWNLRAVSNVASNSTSSRKAVQFRLTGRRGRQRADWRSEIGNQQTFYIFVFVLSKRNFGFRLAIFERSVQLWTKCDVFVTLKSFLKTQNESLHDPKKRPAHLGTKFSWRILVRRAQNPDWSGLPLPRRGHAISQATPQNVLPYCGLGSWRLVSNIGWVTFARSDICANDICAKSLSPSPSLVPFPLT